MKLFISLFIICLISLFGYFFFRDHLANLFFSSYRVPFLSLQIASHDVDLLTNLGDYYFGGGEYNLIKAKRAYEKALSATSTPPLWTHYQLGRIYFVEGSYNKALEEVNLELKYYPENLRSLYVRGLIYGYRNSPGDLERAEADFRRFVEWAPKEWGGYNDLSWILLKQGKDDEVKEVLSKAFIEVPDAEKNPWLWNQKGVAELNLKEYANAATSFESALILANALSIEEWQKAYSANDPGQVENGLSDFRKALEENLQKAKANL